MNEVFHVSAEAIAPTDVHRPLARWLDRLRVPGRDVPSRNRIIVEGKSVSLYTWFHDDEGYVLDDSGERAVRLVTVPLTEPLPPEVAQHLRDYVSGCHRRPRPPS